MYPAQFRYSEEHEWLQVEDNSATVGITDHAQKELGDVVFVELPKVGDKVEAGQACGTVESVKAVSEIYSPVSGEVKEVNTALAETPEWINQDPHGKAWMMKVALSAPAPLDRLMTAEQYEEYLRKESAE
ncbi:MAG: glycine cleavage system protein GcvH [Acidobacteria bacterium]|nr:glycine cleavage system protein GcvH [Acidobacteriota bacterium]MCZ6490721.1 glycine cleavage system protein GcvH [Acidobacteriota bacterium]MCZ6752901.1 glycine cleavage system protein GcvH [Acidobacteriota bacterium]